MTLTNLKSLKTLARRNPQLAFSNLMVRVQDFRLCNFKHYHIINKNDAEQDLEVSLSQLMKDDIKHNNCFSPDEDTKYNSHLCSSKSEYLYFVELLKHLYMIKHSNIRYYVEPFVQYTGNKIVILPLNAHYVIQSINKYSYMVSSSKN